MRSWEWIDGVMGAVRLSIDRGFNSMTNHPRFGSELAPIVGQLGHDRAAIVSHDRDPLLFAVVRSSSIV